MLQEIFDKIGMVLVFVFTREIIRPFGQHAAEDVSPIIEANDHDEDFSHDRDSPENSDHTNSLHNSTAENQDELEGTLNIRTSIDRPTTIVCIERLGTSDNRMIDLTEPEENNEPLQAREQNTARDTEQEEHESTDYGTISMVSSHEERRTLSRSCKTSCCISVTITVAVIPVGLLMTAVLYLDVNTSNVCCQHRFDNNSLPHEVMKYVITGHDIEAVILNVWFQLMLILLFGWKKFKLHYSSTLLLGVLLGLTVAIFKTTLFFLDIDFTRTYYRLPGNAIFLFGVVYTSYFVAKRVCRAPSPNAMHLKKRHVFAIVSTQFFLGFLIAMAYRYTFVPWFRKTKDEIDQAVIALITPTLILLPMVISENLALKSLSFTDEGHIFVLVYFVNGVSILLYGIMQAGVKNLNIFIALSIFRGMLQVFQTATVRIRHNIFTGIWKFLERKCSCLHLGELRDESSQHRRLKVDKEIQVMLYQSIVVILSQAYLVFYLTSNYDVETGKIIEEFIIRRVFIGIGISFLANHVSIVIHIHSFQTRLTEVWDKHWKLHLLAVILGGVMSITYFTSVLLSVFQTFAHSKKYHVKDCTVPFQ